MTTTSAAQAREARQGYGFFARFFHWTTVLFLLALFPVGMYMTYRGGELNIWDDLTNSLYSWHKLAGFSLLALVLLRLLYRLIFGTPGDEPTLNTFQVVASRVVHLGMYILLVAIPLSGWIGTSAFGALTTVGGIQLPAIVGQDKALAEQAFAVHEVLGQMLLVLIVIHVLAALYHYLIRRDNVMARMTSGRG